MNILITGASGFIGNVLIRQLLSKDYNLAVTYRNEPVSKEKIINYCNIPSIDDTTRWESILNNIDVIVHLAARAHVLAETSLYPLDEFRKVNTLGTLHLANCAAKAKVKRFVFLSSIGVNGNQSEIPFTELSPTNPAESYALSKLEAEEGLVEISKNSGMEYVIIRPPLVYGINCPGNLLALLKLISMGIPLPFAAIDNKRSLIGVENLADFILQCIEKPAAQNKTFLIADDSDISTPNLIRLLAEGMNRNCFLFPVPYKLLLATTPIIGKATAVEKLCGNLQIDAGFARKTLSWTQPVAQPYGLVEVSKWFAASRLTKA